MTRLTYPGNSGTPDADDTLDAPGNSGTPDADDTLDAPGNSGTPNSNCWEVVDNSRVKKGGKKKHEAMLEPAHVPAPERAPEPVAHYNPFRDAPLPKIIMDAIAAHPGYIGRPHPSKPGNGQVYPGLAYLLGNIVREFANDDENTKFMTVLHGNVWHLDMVFLFIFCWWDSDLWKTPCADVKRLFVSVNTTSYNTTVIQIFEQDGYNQIL